ncbi:MAG: peptidase domain-containing ABC transporter [Muribaculaceae bacterium]|nr:peptidase domain-containing ABC transporter [Muribaculaceae bacterium]
MGRTFVRQKDVMQCGIACLAMVCRHYGADADIDDIEKLCPSNREGVSLLALSETAEELGLENESAKLTPEQLALVPVPCILHWNQNHFVVLRKVSKNGRYFYVSDPGKGRIRYDAGEFARHWAADADGRGIAMVLQPTEAFYARRDKVLRQKRTLRFIMGYVARYRRHFAQIMLGMLVGSLLQLVLPFMTQAIVDVGIRRQDIGIIWLILLGELMIVLGRAASDFIRRRLLLHISMRVNISLVSDFFIKLLKLPMSYFDRKLTGDLMQRIADHSRVQTFLTSQLLTVSFSLLNFIVLGVVLALYDGLIFGVFLAGSAVYGAWIAMFLRRRKVLDYELFEKQSVNQNKTFQFLTSMQEIKLQDCERRRRWEWEDTQADLFAVQMKILKLTQSEEAGAVFVNEVKNILITVLAATAVISGQLTLGAMLAVQYIIGQLNSPVEQLMSFIYSLQDVKISLERINEVHLGREEEEDADKKAAVIRGDKTIRVEGLCFKYDPHALRHTLRNVGLTIPQGRVTAIVGASGSGKSTLIKLLLGYYKPAEGSIRVGDDSLDSYSLKWWRRQCGVVMQDGVIFSESIARNIAVDDREIDTERLHRAAEIACIHDFVMGLPLQYETKIGAEGNGISQGQRQRILIARAVYRNPDFIFLDEATNSLDAGNERRIVENLAKFYQGRTVVVVAHRLSTVRDADNIVVLDGGQVVESGTHKDLIDRQGEYYRLVKNQLELGN